MNHLAHAHLARRGSPAFLAGSVLGDFVKGPLSDRRPAPLTAGIRLHRRIDGFTDRHPVTRECRGCLPGTWRRYAGIALDVLWDHFLAAEWRHWHPTQSLAVFAREAGHALVRHASHFPPRAATFSQRIYRHRVLEHYADPAGVHAALTHVETRLPAARGLADTALHALELHTGFLESRFRLLYADALALAETRA